jgi:hypothetical protein
LKKYLIIPPKLLVLTMSNVVSTAIVIERGESDTDCKIQYPVYFVSEVLIDSKSLYFHIIKLPYALLIIARKLSYYF